MIHMTIGDAVTNKVVNNETIGYFMARTQLFLESIGIDPTKTRFRQHLPTEMAHYATDCWDLEILLSCGWVETVGHSDRACYDLVQHSKQTGVSMQASMRLPEPMLIDKLICEPNKKAIGPLFKTTQKQIIQALESLEGDDLETFKNNMETNGTALIPNTTFTIDKNCVTFKTEKKNVSEIKYIPGVVEPSFGIGRVLTAVLEHSFMQRDDDRCVMAFRPSVAPIKVGIYRLVNNVAFDSIVEEIREMLTFREIVVKVDSSSGTIGRKYSRADEIGIPYGITIDFDTLTDRTVTIRDRDSMDQMRVPINKLLEIMENLVTEGVATGIKSIDSSRNLFTEYYATYPKIIGQTEGDAEDESNDV